MKIFVGTDLIEIERIKKAVRADVSVKGFTPKRS